MLELRPRAGLGRFTNEWLDARHHFSFASYHDPARMGWGPLLVWNDDRIAPGTGFGTHGHRDMEIVTIIREGAITHADSHGHQGRIGVGEIQVMSAGDGIRHSEWNHEATATSLFQIWIKPRRPGGAPRWDSRHVPDPAPGALAPLASGRDQHAGGLAIDQDATLFVGAVDDGAPVDHRLDGRLGYLVVDSGAVTVSGQRLGPGDALAVRDEPLLTIGAETRSRFYLADLG